MDIYNFEGLIKKALRECLQILEVSESVKVLLTKESFGDFTINIAFKLAKVFKKSPKLVADDIINCIKLDLIESISNVNGYINIKVSSKFYLEFVKSLLEKKENYFILDNNGKSIQVEFVSANPTGPLHVGNGRGGIIGDTIARVLETRGYHVEREYYVNDAGSKMDLFAESVLYFYLKRFGIEKSLSEEAYKGEYIKDIADKIYDVFKDKFLNYDHDLAIEAFKNIGVFLLFGKVKEETEDIEILKQSAPFKIESILKTLERFGVSFDNIFFESSLYEGVDVEVDSTLKLNEKLAKVFLNLFNRGYIYKKDGAYYFKATLFNDDKDRVLVRSTGEPTYTLTDIAYHIDKFNRGYSKAIDVWGQDHFGHVATMKALLKASNIDPDFLDVVLYQVVHLFEDGVEVMMSKHTGKFYTLSELINEVKKDAARFFFLTKSGDTHLNFDINLAKKQSVENPVYYLQYTYARLHNIIEEAKRRGTVFEDIENVFTNLSFNEVERGILNKIFYLNSILDDISVDYSIHRISNYALDLAEDINHFYQNYPVLKEEDKLKQTKRYLIVQVSVVALSFIFDLMGIEKKERM
ncbi:MAG: arginine--tRNA ligase [Caldisericaceae bacterium]